MVTTDASQYGWGGVLGSSMTQSCWTLAEAQLSMNVLELLEIKFSGALGEMSPGTACQDTIKQRHNGDLCQSPQGVLQQFWRYLTLSGG